METAEAIENEKPLLQAWAFAELQTLDFGLRNQLEPILPAPKIAFSVLDAEIATFIAEGQREQARLQEIIDDLESKELDIQSVGTQPDQQSETSNLQTNEIFFYNVSESKMEMLPDVTIQDGGILIDTTNGVDLPDLTFDPRNGGQYESEIPLVQNAFDLVQLVQDQVPAPIQTAGNELYNKITGSEGQP